MSAITTHILDTSRGEPASGIRMALDARAGSGAWDRVAEAVSGPDGRAVLLADGVKPGVYRITFETGAYLARRGDGGFFPEVPVVFEIRDPASHHHVPLLLSPFGYSTYRGT
ncbi:MAG: hydroxyisourate hydrolase [Acidobacteriota bacterium]